MNLLAQNDQRIFGWINGINRSLYVVIKINAVGITGCTVFIDRALYKNDITNSEIVLSTRLSVHGENSICGVVYDPVDGDAAKSGNSAECNGICRGRCAGTVNSGHLHRSLFARTKS